MDCFPLLQTNGMFIADVTKFYLDLCVLKHEKESIFNKKWGGGGGGRCGRGSAIITLEIS